MHRAYCLNQKCDPAELQQAVVERQWQKVRQILPSVRDLGLREWVVKEAIQHAEDHHLKFIIPYCTDDQIGVSLEKAVSRRLWPTVREIFVRVDLFGRRINHADMLAWAVEEVTQHADDKHFEFILTHCADGQVDSALTKAVGRRLWRCVVELIRCRRSCIVRARREWAIDETITHAGDNDMTLLLRYHFRDFSSAQVNSFFTQAVNRGLWTCLCSVSLQKVRTLTHEQRQWVLTGACENAPRYELSIVVRHYCNSESVGVILPKLLRRQEWDIIKKMMPELTETEQQEVILEAIEHTDENHLNKMLVYCPNELLDTFVIKVVQRGLFECVCRLLRYEFLDESVSPEVWWWAVEEAIKYADDEEFVAIISYMAKDQRDAVLTSAVERHLWDVVRNVLGREMADMDAVWLETEKIRWALEEASKHASETQLEHMVDGVPYYKMNVRLDLVVKETVRRGMWVIVSKLLVNPGVSDTVRNWAVDEAAKYTGDVSQYWMEELFSMCTDDQLDCVLTAAVNRKMWYCAIKLIARPVSASQRRWALVEVSKVANDFKLFEVIHFCADDDLDSMLTTVVQRNLWKCVDYLLSRDVSTAKRSWTMEEIFRNAPEHTLLDILARCNGDECSFSALAEVMRRCLFKAANLLLSRLADDQKIRTAVKEAADMLPGDERNTVVTELVRNGAWTIACLMFQESDIRPDTRQVVIERACTLSYGDQANCEAIFRNVVRHCDSSQLMTALRIAVNQNQFRRVLSILTLIGERGDPLAVTDDGRTLLQMVSQFSGPLRRRLVAECIKLGISTHQSSVKRYSLPFNNTKCISRTPHDNEYIYFSSHRVSELLCVCVADLKLVMMLCESGSCSAEEVRAVIHVGTESSSLWYVNNDRLSIIKYLEGVISTPRSLKSTCRLVISHHIGVGCRRQENVKQLLLPDTLKDFVLFSDLVTPAIEESTLNALSVSFSFEEEDEDECEFLEELDDSMQSLLQWEALETLL